MEEHGWEVVERVKRVDELEREYERDPESVAVRYELIWARVTGVSWDPRGGGGGWNGRRGVEVEGLGTWVEKNLPRPG